MNGERKKPPEKKFRASGVEASIWTNSRTFNGQTRDVKSVTVERRYKDPQSGEWKSSSSFRASDLPLVKFVLDEAYRYILSQRQEGSGASVEEEDMTGLQ